MFSDEARRIGLRLASMKLDIPKPMRDEEPLQRGMTYEIDGAFPDPLHHPKDPPKV
jgi:hypothetical protein